jgi:tetratricopeptide (TPR) repeat protein
VRTSPTPECSSDDALRQLAAGLTPDALAAQLTQHAATCDHCGPLLRAYTEIFSDDFTPEEQAALANLQSSSAAWQKNTARQMLEAGAASAVGASASKSDKKASAQTPASSSRDRKPLFWKWILIPATAAVVVAAFSFWYTQHDTPEKVEKLLAQAYTEQRTMEMRIPYAAHANFKQTRSGDTTSLSSSPEALRKAAGKIAASLKVHPDDPKWLLLNARLDLLDWRYKSAIATLNKIDDDQIVNLPEALMTRGVAAFERAEVEHDQQSYFEAMDLFGKILQKNPNETIALFNRAIICEKQHAYECASSDWAHLLKVEKDPGWSAEAREHLNSIQEKKNLAH